MLMTRNQHGSREMTDKKTPSQPAEMTEDALDDISGGPTRRGDLDHVGAYNFKVEISGVSAGYFKGVDGLNAEIEIVSEEPVAKPR